MFRWMTIMTVLLLSMTACSSDEAPTQHAASLSKAIQEAPQPAEEPQTAAVEPESTAEKTSPHATLMPSSDCSVAEFMHSEVKKPTAEQATTSIVSVELQCPFGAVLFNHRAHVEMMSCDTCHTSTPPGKITKSKKEFHATCRGCHADNGAGPTKCRDCHNRE
nr:cytochrome c3 family protein [uncultured Desulfuromonas sp.]